MSIREHLWGIRRSPVAFLEGYEFGYFPKEFFRRIKRIFERYEVKKLLLQRIEYSPGDIQVFFQGKELHVSLIHFDKTSKKMNLIIYEEGEGEYE